MKQAKDYINSTYAKYNREPQESELYEEFIWYVDGSNYNEYNILLPLGRQLGDAKSFIWIQHKARFQRFAAFCRML